MFSAGRITFAENPWPNGHRVESFAWSGRLFPGRGVSFDFDLRTANYYEDDDARGVLDEDDELVSDWKSKSVWSNYHSCIVSSVEWGGSDGFFVGTAKKPLDLDALDGAEFRIDPLPLSGPPTFATYLLGHDSVADHRIEFKSSSSETTDAYDIDWRGKIALTYAGDTEFRHLFEAATKGVMFDGFRIPKGVDGTTAVRELQRFVVGGEQWVVDRRGAALWLLRPAASVPPKANASIKPNANANANAKTAKKTAAKRTAAKKIAPKTTTKKRTAGRE